MQVWTIHINFSLFWGVLVTNYSMFMWKKRYHLASSIQFRDESVALVVPHLVSGNLLNVTFRQPLQFWQVVAGEIVWLFSNDAIAFFVTKTIAPFAVGDLTLRGNCYLREVNFNFSILMTDRFGDTVFSWRGIGKIGFPVRNSGVPVFQTGFAVYEHGALFNYSSWLGFVRRRCHITSLADFCFWTEVLSSCQVRCRCR